MKFRKTIQNSCFRQKTMVISRKKYPWAAVKAKTELSVSKTCRMRTSGHSKTVGHWFKIEKMKYLLAQWGVTLQSLPHRRLLWQLRPAGSKHD